MIVITIAAAAAAAGVIAANINRHTDPSRTGMDAKRGFEQMNLLLTHFGVEAGIGIFEADGLFGGAEVLCV